MIIDRTIKKIIHSKLSSNKVLLLLGPRRAGKTFLLKEIKNTFNEKFLFLNGEDFAVHELLARRSVQNYSNLLGDTKLLIIDEAQKIPEIGMILKLMIDSFSDLKIIVSGSSAFDLTGATGEPLTGRKFDILLFPISEQEYSQFEKPSARFDNLRNRLIVGNMPELEKYPNLVDKQEYLREIVNSYLLKDILAFENIRNSNKILNLLKLISFQIGNEVSLEELGRQLSISKNTVEKYLDVLTKTFVLFKLSGFNRNLRKEITKQSKWYFVDNGIRNAIINNFSSIEQRNDVGALWENYIISERVKFQNNNRLFSNNYFWRTYDKQEIDWIEDRDGILYAYEFKWNNQKANVPKAWSKAYPNSKFSLITKENYFEFLI